MLRAAAGGFKRRKPRADYASGPKRDACGMSIRTRRFANAVWKERIVLPTGVAAAAAASADAAGPGAVVIGPGWAWKTPAGS